MTGEEERRPVPALCRYGYGAVSHTSRFQITAYRDPQSRSLSWLRATGLQEEHLRSDLRTPVVPNRT